MDDNVKLAADAISDAVNRGASKDALAQALLDDHRTLIQLKADVFIRFFRKLAEDYENGYFDERDKAAGERAVIIRNALEDAGFGFGGLPFI